MPSSSSKPETIELVSAEASQIVNVSLYTGRAEVTRVYPFEAKAGKNHVRILGLPNVLQENSLRVRVEDHDSGTIHGVSVILTPPPDDKTSGDSPIPALIAKQRELEMALTRAKKLSASLDAYLSTVTTGHIDVESLAKTFEQIEITAHGLDNKIVDAENKLKDVNHRLSVEYDNEHIRNSQEGGDLGKSALVDLFAATEGKIKLVLIYAVNEANWTAGYDIRVDTQSKERPVTLVYKASITQLTGESWDDVPMTLETVCPTFGVGLPSLGTWRLTGLRGSSASQPLAPPSLGRRRTSLIVLSGREAESDVSIEEVESEKDSLPKAPSHTGVDISEKHTSSATYLVPGVVSIPSDGCPHDVIITELKLSASMSWMCVPRIDTRVHLKANIKNSSEHVLLSGIVNVFVDGSFISKSEIPSIRPQEAFDCSLGIDPSIRVIYHPISCVASQAGPFYARSVSRSYTQRLTIQNTKEAILDKLTVIEHLPVPEDSQINVRLVTPALVLPTPAKPLPNGSANKNGTHDKGEVLVAPPAPVAEGVIAQWADADQSDVDAATLGRDGKFAWVCSLAPQAKVDLLSQWEVSAPANLTIFGL